MGLNHRTESWLLHENALSSATMADSALDSLWVVLCAALVFFMHAGFALVECGLCRRKNAVMVLLKNVGVISLSSLVFFALGFGLMFGESAGIFGLHLLGLSGFLPAPDATLSAVPANLPLYVFLFFQLVFAATAATIVSGAVAERVRVVPFFVFTAVAAAVIYPIAGHWVWGGGFLDRLGFHDFAGSTVVHAAGGAMAIAGVKLIGPRLGRYAQDGTPRPMPAHNMPLAALGVLILWLGWFGFNGGSTLAANPAAIAPVILVTNLSASAGFMSALAYARWRSGSLDLSLALNGALAGLVGITAGADVIGPSAAILVGTICGALVVEGVLLLDRLQLDDPVGAIPVHLLAGIFGTLAVGLFANTSEVRGVFFGGDLTVLATQALGVALVCCFAGMTSSLTWLTLKATLGVRVAASHEIEGLDQAECGAHAYEDPLHTTPHVAAATA